LPPPAKPSASAAADRRPAWNSTAIGTFECRKVAAMGGRGRARLRRPAAMSNKTPNETRQRAPSAVSILRRRAQDAVAPLRAQIAAHQLTVARMATLARRGENDKIQAERDRLTAAVEDLRAEFAALETRLAPDIAASVEVRDAGRALERLAAYVASLCAMLGGAPLSSTSGAAWPRDQSAERRPEDAWAQLE